MKNVLKIIIASAMLASSGCAATPKKEKVVGDVKYATILQDGVKRRVVVSNTNGLKIVSKSAKDSSKDGVIVEFNDSSAVNIAAFEAKYGLKFKKKLVIGYYIFLNKSSKTDLEIVDDIMKNESNIKTLKPNWKLNVSPK